MKKKNIGIIILVIIIFCIAFVSISNVLVLAEDDTEGSIPGIDMAALWSLNGGFQWIYPGSSFDSQGRTLHNIYMTDNPYQEAKAIMENTYNVTPHILIIVNDKAAEDIFGDDLLDNIRQHDWGEHNSRGDAISMSITSVNPLPIIPDILMGNIKIMFI